MRLLAVAILLCAGLDSIARLHGDDDVERAAIREVDLLRHLNFLASDTLEGREAGTSGGRAAAAYISGELRRLGLQPAGDPGQFTQEFGAGYANLLALLPGSDESLREEYVVLCAHFDHVGYGRRGNAYGPIGYIHNGADDNASGTSAVLEVAEALSLAGEKPRRSILFAWWDAEEINLNGSEYWRSHPTLPLREARLAVNVDMVGRLAESGVTVHGARTAAGLRMLVSLANCDSDLLLDFDRRHVRDSDHYPFLQARVPYLFFDTGKHSDYHRPTDDVDRLNLPGLQQVAGLVCSVVRAAAQDELAAFRTECLAEARLAEPEASGRRVATPVRLGITWFPRLAGEPVRIRSVDPGAAAARAGLRIGDQLLQFNGRDIATVEHFATQVAMSESPAVFEVARQGSAEPLVFSVDLSGPPIAGGCVTRHDTAEPAAQIVTQVLPGSPAERAGLAVGDRVLRSPWTATGQNTASSEVVVERQGRIINLMLPPPDAGGGQGSDGRAASTP